MSHPILVGYATRYGSTREVAEAAAAALRECGLAVEVKPASEVRSLAEYGAVVLGAPLLMFRWHADAVKFLQRHREALMERPVAIFALGSTSDPQVEQEWRSARAQLDKELARFPWLKPVGVEIFGGKFDPATLRFPLKQLAGKAPATDIRDWEAIRAWAARLAAQLSHEPVDLKG